MKLKPEIRESLMRNCVIISCGIAIVLLMPAFSGYAAEFTPDLTAYGHPNLQGNWTTETATPFQRTEELGEQKTYTSEEAKEFHVRIFCLFVVSPLLLIQSKLQLDPICSIR